LFTISGRKGIIFKAPDLIFLQETTINLYWNSLPI